MHPTWTVLILLSLAATTVGVEIISKVLTPGVRSTSAGTSISSSRSFRATPPPPSPSILSSALLPVSAAKDSASLFTRLMSYPMTYTNVIVNDGRSTHGMPTTHELQHPKLTSKRFAEPALSSAAVPALQSSSQLPGSNSPPTVHQPTRQQSSSTSVIRWAPITSQAVPVDSGEVMHCQVQLANVYEQTLNLSGSSSEIYGRELGARIAALCRVDDTRITDVIVVENPETDLMVLRFNIQPATKSCRQGCYLTTSQVAQNLRDLVNSFSFKLPDISFQTLFVDQLPAFHSWTDGGPCPNTTCQDGDVCNVQLTGQFYCQCAVNCSAELMEPAAASSDNNDLWALFVIPCVVVIAILIVLILLVYKRRQVIRNKIGAKSLRDYKPAYDIETLKQQPMLATLDPGAKQLFQSLECQLGIVFNDRSFDATSSCPDTFMSPFSTVRINTSSTNVAEPADEKQQ